jgi:hypothetical protein
VKERRRKREKEIAREKEREKVRKMNWFLKEEGKKEDAVPMTE